MVDKRRVVSVARRLRAAYCGLRSRMAKQPVNPGKKYGKYWVKAALACIENRISPEEYMEVQFDAMKPYPEIAQICGARALTRYFDGRKDRATAIAQHVAMQMSALEHLMSLGKDIEQIFADPNQEFDPLFKCLMLRRHGLVDASEEYYSEAFDQYLLSVYYDSVYRELIPDSFRQRVGGSTDEVD